MKKLRVLELFAGIGGNRYSLTLLKEQLGIEFEIVDAVEINPNPLSMYNNMYGTNHGPQDVMKYKKTTKELGNVDIITHSSPCQDISTQGLRAGAEEGSGTRSSLMFESVRIVKDLRPKVVLYENVMGLLSKRNRNAYDSYKDYLMELGYRNYTIVMNACDYGCPQLRPRVYTISVLKDFSLKGFFKPTEFYNDILLKDIVMDKSEVERLKWYDMTNKTIDQDLLSLNRVKLYRDYEYKEINKDFIVYPRVCIKGMIDQPFRSTAGVYGQNGIAPTLDTKSEVKVAFKEDLTEPEAFRYLTIQECFRLQGFSDELFFKAFEANRAHSVLRLAIGNSMSTGPVYHLFRDMIVTYFGEEYYDKEKLKTERYEVPCFSGKGIYK